MLSGRRQCIPAVSYRILSNDVGSKIALYQGQQKLQLAEKERHLYLTFNFYLPSDRNSPDSQSLFESIQRKVMPEVCVSGSQNNVICAGSVLFIAASSITCPMPRQTLYV